MNFNWCYTKKNTIIDLPVLTRQFPVSSSSVHNPNWKPSRELWNRKNCFLSMKALCTKLLRTDGWYVAIENYQKLLSLQVWLLINLSPWNMYCVVLVSATKDPCMHVSCAVTLKSLTNKGFHITAWHVSLSLVISTTWHVSFIYRGSTLPNI